MGSGSGAGPAEDDELVHADNPKTNKNAIDVIVFDILLSNFYSYSSVILYFVMVFSIEI